MVQQSNDEIRARPCPDCYLCGAQGKPLYQGLKDRLFGAPGEWNLKKCPNPECGLVWLDPMPLEEDISKAYQNYYTHQDRYISNTWPRRVYRLAKEGYLVRKYGYYTESVATWKKFLGIFVYLDPGRRAALDASIMYLPAQPNGRLLEVGCGSGQMLKLMQDLGWRVEGVDFDPAAVENAQAKGLQVRLGTLESQVYPDDYFDAITMSHLIEHVHDPLQLLRECNRILRPGGSLVVVTPNGGSWGHKLFRDAWRGLEPPRHLHVFTIPSLYCLAEKAGFKKLRISTTIRGANGLFMASRSIQRTGKHVNGGPQPRAVRIWARGMQLVEWAILKVKPDIGEEITLMGKK